MYLEQLLPALAAEGVEAIAAQDFARRPPGAGGIASLANAAHDLRWRERLARMARRCEADVIHHPLPARSWSADRPQVVTVHDLAYLLQPALFSTRYRLHARLEHGLAARRAAAVVCVTQATRHDLIARVGVDPTRVIVAHHGPGQFAAGPPAGHGEQLRAQASGYYLYVGDAEPRKNLPLLMEGHARYREAARAAGEPALELVLAGALSALAWQRGVTVVGRPSRQRLGELLRGATALVHPARVEGFGLTPLEAMACGTPVLALRSPAVVEVCAGAARYLDEEDPGVLAHELRRLALDGELGAQLRGQGLARAAEFSWAASARAHIEAYTLALRSVTSRRPPQQRDR